jgi:hypothetical protein
MIPSEAWLSPTRATGIAAYAVAAACSAIAWARAHGMQVVSKLAASLTVIESLLLIDMIVNARWILHDMFATAAQRRHEYDLRHLPQSLVVAVLVGILLMGLIYTARLYRARIGAILAVSGALLSLVTWCIEVVSLHQVDAILYHPVGNLMAVSLGWVLASLLTSVGILIDARQPFRSSCF